MGIYLSGADAAMPKHALNTSNISTVHEEVGRRAVTHGVWADMFRDA